MAALTGPSVAIVAEVKRRSPSAGAINEALDPVDLARAYAAGGAAVFGYEFLSPNVLYEPSPIVDSGKPDDVSFQLVLREAGVLEKPSIHGGNEEVQVPVSSPAGSVYPPPGPNP